MNNRRDQISGIESNHNYTYKQRHISPQQEEFVEKNSSFIPSSTYGNVDRTNSARLENMNDFGAYKVNENFKEHHPIQNMSDFAYKNNTLYANMNDDLLYQTIDEVRIDIDSMDRDVILYPDPFEFTVLFAPVVNSNVNSSSSNLKSDLKKADRNRNLSYKEIMDIEKINNTKNKNSANNSISTKSIIENEFDKFVEIEQTHDKNTFNPNIINKFQNVKYVKLDNIVLPKYNHLRINEKWIYCQKRKRHVPGNELERIQQCEFRHKRYIPNVHICSSLYSDRFVQINIKELQNVKNLSTNNANSLAFTIYPDKPLGVLYWRGNPYYAVRTYEKTLLGNINKFTISFLDSWNNKLTLNMDDVNYEINQIKSTVLLKTDLNIQLIFTDEKFKKFIIAKLIEIIKCIVMINYDIKNLIPFYSRIIGQSDLSHICEFTEDIIDANTSKYCVCNMYDELNAFVSLDGFVKSQKTMVNNTKVFVDINSYIENVIFYDDYNNLKTINNILSLYNNYIIFGYKILLSLKQEIFEIPRNKYFQNHMTFVLGVYKNELNTKIDYEV